MTSCSTNAVTHDITHRSCLIRYTSHKYLRLQKCCNCNSCQTEKSLFYFLKMIWLWLETSLYFNCIQLCSIKLMQKLAAHQFLKIRYASYSNQVMFTRWYTFEAITGILAAFVANPIPNTIASSLPTNDAIWFSSWVWSEDVPLKMKQEKP